MRRSRVIYTSANGGAPPPRLNGDTRFRNRTSPAAVSSARPGSCPPRGKDTQEHGSKHINQKTRSAKRDRSQRRDARKLGPRHVLRGEARAPAPSWIAHPRHEQSTARTTI